MPLWYLPTAIFANALLAAGALRARAVTAGGAAAGFIVGSLIFLGGGPLFWFVLGAFFVSSSLLSRLGKGVKRGLDRIHQKGARRDALQVAANGGVGALAALIHGLFPGEPAAAAFLASFAAAAADTWASELGVLSGSPPRSILTMRRVEPGSSGGVSLLGTAAAAAGALFIGMIALLRIRPGTVFPPLSTALIAVLAGFAGSLVDSLLGASCQAKYLTPDGDQTERRGDGTVPNRLIRGIPWIDNDVVNFLSILTAAAAAWGAALLVSAG